MKYIIIIVIVAIIFSLLINSNMKLHNQSNSYANSVPDKFIASSTVIFWTMPANDQDGEKKLRKILSSLGVNYQDLSSQDWDPKNSTIGGIRDIKLSKISHEDLRFSLLLSINSLLSNSISAELSKTLKTPVIALFEFHQMSWGYKLYQEGKCIDQFCSIPESIDMPESDCKGNIDLLSELYIVDKKLIEPYLVFNNSDKYEKAFQEDSYFLDDHWVRVDFISKLGLKYPDVGKWFYIKE